VELLRPGILTLSLRLLRVETLTIKRGIIDTRNIDTEFETIESRITLTIRRGIIETWNIDTESETIETRNIDTETWNC